MRPFPYFLEPEQIRFGDSVFRGKDENGPCWHLFESAIEIISITRADEIAQAFERIESHRNQGGWAAITVAYEAAPAFDPAFKVRTHESDPVLWAALYKSPPSRYRELAPCNCPIELSPPSLNPSEYRARFESVKQNLADGDVYQINLTFPQEFTYQGSPAEFFFDRCGVDPPDFATFIHMGPRQVASFSPELFFERSEGLLRSSPMKGTAIAPRLRKELNEAAKELAADTKSRAENLMIADMVRNDIGVIADYGSVRAAELFRVERFQSLLQMSSTIEGRTNAILSDVFRAMFPAASVTGAPKVHAMRRISELESEPRGIYCGAIGLAGPATERFSVAIRTAVLSASERIGTFGIGSGIVWDSNLEDEYAECLLKRDRLLRSGIPWRIRDAIAVDRLNDNVRMEQHLDRLEANASAFGIPYNRSAVRSELLSHSTPPVQDREKVRITIDRNGNLESERLPSVVEADSMRVRIADEPVQSGDVNLHRKTTSRAMLDRIRDRLPDCNDVLFYNEHGCLTEFGYANVVVERGGKRWTPMLEDGCLQGIGVQEMIDRGEVERTRIPLDWLDGSTQVFYVNSVAGLVPVELLSTLPGKSHKISGSSP